MEFFNRKEEVVDIQLTQFGKHLLSKGQFKPTYYNFFDDDVLYDGGYGDIIELQKDTEDRIKETPRIKTQHVFHGVGTEIVKDINSKREELAIARKMGAIPGEEFEEVQLIQPSPEKYYTTAAPLGTSEVGNQEAPAWQITFWNGYYTGSVSNFTDPYTSALRVPQLESEVVYNSFVSTSEISPDDEEVDDNDFFDDVDEGTQQPIQFADGTEIIVEDNFLLLELEERNGFYTNDDFEVEIYRVDTTIVPKRTLGGVVGIESTFETLVPLSFPKENQNFEITENNILKIKNVPEAVSNAPINTSMVEYFFDVAVDSEIPSDTICQFKPVDKKRGLFSPRYYECEEEVEERSRVDIYTESQYEDECD
jgi:hypothetical protein